MIKKYIDSPIWLLTIIALIVGSLVLEFLSDEYMGTIFILSISLLSLSSTVRSKFKMARVLLMFAAVVLALTHVFIIQSDRSMLNIIIASTFTILIAISAISTWRKPVES